MRRRAAHSRDTLQTHRLPSTEHMELNYRPALPSAALWAPGNAWGALAKVASFLVLFAALEFLSPSFGNGWNTLLLLAIAYGAFAFSGERIPFGRWSGRQVVERGLFLAAVAAIALGGVLAPREWTALVAFAPLAIVALGLSYFMAKQFAHWAAVNPRVDWDVTRAWQSHWTKLLTSETPPACPELLETRAAAVALGVQIWLAAETMWQFDRVGSSPARAGLGALAAFVGPLPLYWFAWRAFCPGEHVPLGAVLRGVTKSVEVWFGYGRKRTGAPGVFLLPDKWLRSPVARETVAATAVATVANSVLLLSREPGRLSPVTFCSELANLFFGGWSPTNGFYLQVGVVLVAALVIPILVLGLLYTFLAGSLVGRYWLALEAPHAYAQSPDKTPWAILVNRILNSRDRREREHLLLGRAIFGDYPVLLHKPLLLQHGHIVGDSGSRKSSLGIAPLVAQLMAARDASVIVIDLKGDRSLFETARLEAEAGGAEFRWFTLDEGHSTHVFNPLQQSSFLRLPPDARAQLMLEGLALNFGDAYGRGFYSAMNEIVMRKVLRNYNPRNFRELHQILSDKEAYAAVGESEEWNNARHEAALVDRLLAYDCCNLRLDELSPEAQEATIDVGRIMEQRQLVYFNLRSPIEPITAPAIAKFALRAVFAASGHRTPEQTKRVFIIIDEFQQLVTDSIKLALEQARQNDVHMILAHQSVEQLDRQAVDIIDTVESCTAFKQIFRASNERTIERIAEMSGEAIYESLAWTQTLPPDFGDDDDGGLSPFSAEGQVVTVSETVGARLDRNTIMDISSAPRTSFVAVTEGSGYTQFSSYITPIVSDFHISRSEYNRRNKAAWPEATPQTIVNPVLSAPAAAAAPPSAAEWETRLQDAAGDGR